MLTQKKCKHIGALSQKYIPQGLFIKGFVAASLVTLPVIASAEITLSGSTLSWPDNGWYQVQDSNTYEIICQGGRACDVEDGDYFVDRFVENGGERITITVGNSPLTEITAKDFSDSLSISSKTISWSVDGWYQVLDGNTFAEICDGDTSCTVPANGLYTVINHSLNLRTDVFVGKDPGDSVTVSGNTISWPDDGWYQVQNAETLGSLCEGGTSCVVQPGKYTVINHTTGLRFNKEVEVGTVTPPSGQAVNAENAESIIRQVFRVLNGTAYDDRMISAGSIDFDSSGLSIVSEARPNNPDNTTRERTYTCSNGGTLYENFSTAGISAQFYSHSYDQCQIGDDLINGDVVRVLPLGNNESIELSFTDYTVVTGTDEVMRVSGEFSQITSNRQSAIDAQNLVNSDGLSYSLRIAGSSEFVGNTTTDYDFVLRRGNPAVLDRSANTDGKFAMSLRSMDTTVSVEISDALDIEGSSDQQYFNRGRFLISSEFDSSSLEFNADGGDEASATVTIRSRDGAAEPFTLPWTKFQDTFRFN